MGNLLDQELLRQYVAEHSQAAFAQIARRYVDLVYSAALRQIRDRHLAEDVTQAVFLVLSRKAHTLRPGTPLSAWLHKTTRYVVVDLLRARARRAKLEKRIAEMQRDVAIDSRDAADDWTALSAVLDDAVAHLPQRDRQAVLLRFFENKPLAEVGASLGVSADAARMRIERAVVRLRDFFKRRGVNISATALAPILLTRATECAPAHLADRVIVPAIAAPIAIATIASGAAKAMFWRQFRQVAAAILVIGVVACGATAVVTTARPAIFYGQSARTPIEGANRYLAAAFAGDVETLRASVHTTSPLEGRRAAAYAQLYVAAARFRSACDDAFGRGKMKATRFHGWSFDVTVPEEAPLQVDDRGVTLVPIPNSFLPLASIDGVWKVDESALWRQRYKTVIDGGYSPIESIDSEKLITNIDYLRALFDRVRGQIEGGAIRNADDAFKSLNHAMHGLAAKIPPHFAPLVMDVED